LDIIERNRSNMAKATSAVLTTPEKTTVIALNDQRQRLVLEANRQLAELDAAMKDLQLLYASKYGLAGDKFGFRQEGEHLILERVTDEADPPTEE
jgi:phosphopantetheine adenylyltransferase